ncbi:hypothetical protein [Salinimicrobium sp. GXAS 041]|uniref:hypothetical protein n=1 Tax=Salinimicrobium sp. GXAS 041 TaxID=3400806 RepID=UPI003C789740
MERKVIYQTLEDKENPEEVEQQGPFPCNWGNAWLGNGYYFWDTFIENAHWWGKKHRKDKYIICKSTFDYSDKTCFDLVGNTSHMLDFEKSVDLMRKQGLVNKKTTVARVISFMKEKTKVLEQQSVRVYGINSKSEKTKPNYRLKFELNKPQYLVYKPAIQICLFGFKGINLGEFSIVYPDIYINEYVI